MNENDKKNNDFIFAGKNEDGSINPSSQILNINKQLESLLENIKNKQETIAQQNITTSTKEEDIDIKSELKKDLSAIGIKFQNKYPNFSSVLSNLSDKFKLSPEEKSSIEQTENISKPLTPTSVTINTQSESNVLKEVKEQKQEEVKVEIPKVEEFKLTSERKKQIRDLPTNIKTKIFGQDDVIDDVVSILKTAFAGLSSNKKKPKGAYIFAGPSGCGKTETVNQIAEYLNIPIKKFSMTEFSEENDVKKLIGAPAGYVGYEDGGQLTNFVKDNPNAIILFDEIEKADPSLSKILLGLLEDGKLTDGKGQEIQFNQTMFFATSNLGSEIEYAKNIDLKTKEEYRMNAIKEFFPIEVINRFDSLIQFKSISEEVYKKIVTKVLNNLSEDFTKNQNIKFTYDDSALDFIVKNSYDPAMGGRPAGRFISKVLIKILVDKIFDDSLDGVENVKLSINSKNNIVFKNQQNKIIIEVKDTEELLEKYNQTKLNKEEIKSKEKANKDVVYLEAPEETLPLNSISLNPTEKVKKPTKKAAILKTIADSTADPLIQKIQRNRTESKLKPKKR